MLEDGGSQIHRTKHIAETRRQKLLDFQLAAERQHREVRGQGKGGAVPVDVLIIASRGGV